MRRVSSILIAASLCAAAPALAAPAPAGEWPLDERSWAGGVSDTSGYGHHGVALGGAIPGGQSGVFDNKPGCGECARVEVEGDLGLGNAAALTVSAWVKWTIDPRTATPRAVIVSQSSTTTAALGATTANAGLFWIRAGGDAATPAYSFGVRIGTLNVFQTGMSPPVAGQWTHLAGVFDGKTLFFYVNGALEAQTAMAGRVAPMRPEYRLSVGAAPFDEGGAYGRRGFTGEVADVRVFAEALDPQTLRATACGAAPADAITTYCGGAQPLCAACLDLSLTATRWYSPSQEMAGVRDACRTVRFAIPAMLPVATGAAGAGKATLGFGVGGEQVTCTYAAFDKSTYAFGGCSNGARAGDTATADHFALRVVSGDATAGPTRVAVTLAEAGASPSIRLVAPPDGTVTSAEIALDYATSGALPGAVVATLDGRPFDRAAPIGEGPHVFTVTAGGCHVPTVTAGTSFVIDRTPPTLYIDGVADGEVREGPVDIRLAAIDATDVIVDGVLDDRNFTGTARATAVGTHLLFAHARDAAGHVVSIRRAFEIRQLVTGLDDVVRMTDFDLPACDGKPAGQRTLLDLCNDACAAKGLVPGAKVSGVICAEQCDSQAGQALITAQRCADRKWLDSICGQLEQKKWAEYINEWSGKAGVGPFSSSSACAQLKADLSVSEADGVAVGLKNPPVPKKESRLLPLETAHGDGTPGHYDPHTVDKNPVDHFVSNTPGMHHTGGTHSWGGIRRRESIRAFSPGAYLPGVSYLTPLRRAAWEANGNKVGSCEEYVYEKYYNFSKYEDQVESLGGNFRAYVDAAFAAGQNLLLQTVQGTDLVPIGGGGGGGNNVGAWPVSMVNMLAKNGWLLNLPPAYAIGSMGELHMPIRSRNGTPVALQFDDIAAASPHYKNVFFSMATTDPTEQAELAQITKDYSAPDPDDTCQIRPAGITHIGLCDPALSQTVQAGHEIKVDRTWTYHRQKSALLAQHWTDEDLYLADQMKDHFQDLLDGRSAITGRIMALLKAPAHKNYVTLPAPQMPWDIYTSHTDASIVAMQSLKGAGGLQSSLADHGAAFAPQTQGLVGGQNPFDQLMNLTQSRPALVIDTASPLAAVAPVQAQRYGSASQAGLIPVAGGFVETLGSQVAFDNSLQSLFARLVRQDMLIEAALKEAEAFGCLALDENNPCDWSPRDFVQVVKDYYQPEQEASYQLCRQNTATVKFSQLAAGYALAITDDVNSLTAKPMHYGGSTHYYAGKYQNITEPADRVLAIGKKYAPDPNQPQSYVEKVFPRVRGQGFDDGVCKNDPNAPSGMSCTGNPDGFMDSWDSTTCVLDPTGEPYRGFHDYPSSGLPQNPECPGCNVWTKNTDTMDLYFECVDLYKQMIYSAVTDKVGPILDETGRAKLGSSASESETLGDDDWNLNYGYSFGWTFGNFEAYRTNPSPANLCKLQPEMYGSMHFGARAMGTDIDVARGSAHARTSVVNGDPAFEATIPNDVKLDSIEGHVDIAVLKINVSQATQAGGVFNVVADNEERDEGDVPDPPITVPFALGPIPMSLKAGLTGYVGVGYSAHARLPAQGAPCDSQSLSASFRPFAGIDGFASVGLDILIAEAGVKITLTIIRADLPFTESVGLVNDAKQGVSAFFNTNLDLVLSTLGGRFSVYLRILFASWEWDLFTWEGLSQKLNLLHTEMQVPLAPLTDAVNAVSANPPAMPK